MLDDVSLLNQRLNIETSSIHRHSTDASVVPMFLKAAAKQLNVALRHDGIGNAGTTCRGRITVVVQSMPLPTSELIAELEELDRNQITVNFGEASALPISSCDGIVLILRVGEPTIDPSRQSARSRCRRPINPPDPQRARLQVQGSSKKKSMPPQQSMCRHRTYSTVSLLSTDARPFLVSLLTCWLIVLSACSGRRIRRHSS